MAILRSTAAVQGFAPPNFPQNALIRIPFPLAITGAVASGDFFYLGRILAKSTLTGFVCDIPELDTDASATGTLIVGDLADDDRYITTSNAARNSGRINSAADDALGSDFQGSIFGTLPRVYTDPDMLVLKLTGTVATAATTGTLRGWYDYCMFPFYNFGR